MDARTRKALEDSIAHWERMTADPKCGEEPYIDCCALCREFFSKGCTGCPVDERSGGMGCLKTPYKDARRAFEVVVHDGRKYTERRHAAMQAEVDFLKSLRPEGEQ